MRLLCEACREPIPEVNVDAEQRVATCARCEAVFSIPLDAASTPRRRPPLPKGIAIESGGLALSEEGYRIPAFTEGAAPLIISRRWLRWQHLVFVMVALGWDASVVSWYVVAIARDVPVSMFAAPLLLVVVAVAVTYYAAVLFFNRTHVRVGDGKLEIRHRPLPWRKGVELETKRLRQIYLRRCSARGEGDSISSTWDVEAELDDGESVLLVRRIPNRAQAEYIEWAIEVHLRIPDDPSYLQLD